PGRAGAARCRGAALAGVAGRRPSVARPPGARPWGRTPRPHPGGGRPVRAAGPVGPAGLGERGHRRSGSGLRRHALRRRPGRPGPALGRLPGGGRRGARRSALARPGSGLLPLGPCGAARPGHRPPGVDADRAAEDAPVSGATAYTVHGSGRPVVLVAGAGGAGRIWERHQVPALTAAGHQVITFDHGAPGSCAGDVAALTRQLLTTLGLPPCPLVGHSVGALAVQELLVTDPHLACAAVLAATRGRPDPVGDALARAEAAQTGAGGRPSPEYEAVVGMAQNLSPRTLADEDAVTEWLDLFEIAALSGSSAAGRPCPPLADRLAAYARITAPVLVVGF